MSLQGKIFLTYIMLILLLLLSNEAFSQVVVTHFNAAWNEPNKSEWVGELTDCEITYVDISGSPKIQKKHKVTVLPTIIIFKDGEEINRWEADLSFKMSATREELQNYVNELIEDKF
jgi:thiol-disulfide isomerase/thioredoxin|tara:strand:- start:1394 stop:1744 length:351 start_codon:yes stop_codon:yes gene_type:complete